MIDKREPAEMTLEEVAKVLGLTHQRIRQIEKAAFRKIRTALRRGGYPALAEDFHEQLKAMFAIDRAAVFENAHRQCGRRLEQATQDRYNAQRRARRAQSKQDE